VPIEEAAPGDVPEDPLSWMERMRRRLLVRRLWRYNRTSCWQWEGLLFRFMMTVSREDGDLRNPAERSVNLLVTRQWRRGPRVEEIEE